MTVLVTGAAGFIGYHFVMKLLNKGLEVTGFDNLNSYYDVNLKEARVQNLRDFSVKNRVKFSLIKSDLENIDTLREVFKNNRFEYVVNLAAQAGVRYSIQNPSAYIQSNIVGFLNILECCRDFKVKHLLYASSSSVYGGNAKMPFSEKQVVDHPISIYAATKKSNELMAHTYSHLYDIPATGLRFFTVYGPWGRPDMALFLFTKSIIEKKSIKIFNNGDMIRDFTYIDDITESMVRLLNKIPQKNENFNKLLPDSDSSWCAHKVFNIGNSKPTQLIDYISAIERSLGIKAIKEYLPIQPGDVKKTYADTTSLEKWINFRPNTDINYGVKKFVDWYKNYHKILD